MSLSTQNNGFKQTEKKKEKFLKTLLLDHVLTFQEKKTATFMLAPCSHAFGNNGQILFRVLAADKHTAAQTLHHRRG